jgi:hypothetical protein
MEMVNFCILYLRYRFLHFNIYLAHLKRFVKQLKDDIKISVISTKNSASKNEVNLAKLH